MYVHVPFCATRCDYCDFATWTDRGALIDDYVAACVADLDGRVLTIRAEDIQAVARLFDLSAVAMRERLDDLGLCLHR